MTSQQEPTREQLALRVIELLDLRDKLLEQNKSYQNLAMEAKPTRDDVIAAIVRKRKTFLNVLGFVASEKLDSLLAEKMLRQALNENRSWSQSQIMAEIKDNP